jgi:uncharacterized membrane protein (UPF0127 family)
MESGFIYIHNNVFPTLLAISEEEQSKGLMYRDWPPPVMSFVYASPQLNRFWMKNTPSPLDIVFCCDGKIKQIAKGESFSTRAVGDFESDLVIELPYGTAKGSGIEVGQSVGLVRPTADEIKKIIAEKRNNFAKY